jgi:hypothetical protein
MVFSSYRFPLGYVTSISLSASIPVTEPAYKIKIEIEDIEKIKIKKNFFFFLNINH